MKRLTYRDEEGRAQWMPELLEDDTGWAAALVRQNLAEYEDAAEKEEQLGNIGTDF